MAKVKASRSVPQSAMRDPQLPAVAIVGAGAVGCAVGRLLRGAGYEVCAVASGSLRSARAGAEFMGGGAGVRVCRKAARATRGAGVVLITTPDRAIAGVCREMAEAGVPGRGTVVLHCSGAYGPELLAPVRRRGARVGALHPVQSFASAEQAVRRLPGAWFTFAGDAEAEARARGMVEALGGRMVSVAPKERALYHAALCVVSNYMVGLADLGIGLLVRAGMAREEAAAATAPLMRGTVENVAAVGVPDALTGPIARGDVATVAGHLRALEAVGSEAAAVYRTLGVYVVDVARRKGGLRAREARALLRLLRR